MYSIIPGIKKEKKYSSKIPDLKVGVKGVLLINIPQQRKPKINLS